MIAELFDTFFGCRHSHYSFPITVRPRFAPQFSGKAYRHLCGLSGLRQRISLRLAGDEGHHLSLGAAQLRGVAGRRRPPHNERFDQVHK